MEWLTLDLAARIIVPICTFVLGVVFTLFSRKFELRRLIEHEHLKSLVELTNKWYNQIHQLSVDEKYETDPQSQARGTYFYINNRLVLPEMLLHISYLRECNKYADIVSEADKFLSLITWTRIASANYGRIYTCRSPDDVHQLWKSAGNNSQRRKEILSETFDVAFFERLIGELDGHLQNITCLAGRALAK